MVLAISGVSDARQDSSNHKCAAISIGSSSTDLDEIRKKTISPPFHCTNSHV